MIALPSLSAVPGTVAAAHADQLAARCALALAQPGPIPRVRSRKDPVEHTLLRLEVEVALFAATRGLRIFRPRLHVHLGEAPAPCDCCEGSPQPITIWIGNANGQAIDARFELERRWRSLERAVPGLAPTALRMLHHGAVPVYTPMMALGMAQWTYWRGELDERCVLEEWAEQELHDDTEDAPPATPDEIAEQVGVITHAKIDSTLPREVSEPKRGLPMRELERLAAGRGAGKELARRAVALWHEEKTQAHHARERAFALHTQQDELWALGFGAAVRWNARDPMYRIFDDHANYLFESSSAVEEAWGWFVVGGPQDLRRFFAHLEARMAIARKVEDLLEALAERVKA